MTPINHFVVSFKGNPGFIPTSLPIAPASVSHPSLSAYQGWSMHLSQQQAQKC